MAFNTTIIKRNIGFGDVYYGATMPADRTPMALAAGGIPTGGTHVGATQGESSWNYVPTVQGVEIEQVQGPVAPHLVSEELKLTFTMMERDYSKLAAVAFQMGTALSSGGINRVHFGGKTDVVTGCFCLVAKSSDQNTYDVFVIYDGYAVPAALAWKRGEARGVQVTVTAQAVSGRTVGDTLGQALDDVVPAA